MMMLRRCSREHSFYISPTEIIALLSKIDERGLLLLAAPKTGFKAVCVPAAVELDARDANPKGALNSRRRNTPAIQTLKTGSNITRGHVLDRAAATNSTGTVSGLQGQPDVVLKHTYSLGV